MGSLRINGRRFTHNGQTLRIPSEFLKRVSYSVRRAFSLTQANDFYTFPSEFGNATEGCASTGTHFNPSNKAHGGPTGANRHAGDLGNLNSDVAGNATIDIMVSELTLDSGQFSVLG
jgi:hypothetical protein